MRARARAAHVPRKRRCPPCASALRRVIDRGSARGPASSCRGVAPLGPSSDPAAAVVGRSSPWAVSEPRGSDRGRSRVAACSSSAAPRRPLAPASPRVGFAPPPGQCACVRASRTHVWTKAGQRPGRVGFAPRQDRGRPNRDGDPGRVARRVRVLSDVRRRRPRWASRRSAAPWTRARCAGGPARAHICACAVHAAHARKPGPQSGGPVRPLGFSLLNGEPFRVHRAYLLHCNFPALLLGTK